MSKVTEQNSIRDILDVLFRYKWRVLQTTAFVIVAVTVYNVVVADVYESDAKLLVRRGRQDVSVAPSIEGASAMFAQNIESEVNSELAILKSRQLVEAVVSKVGPDAVLANSRKYPGLSKLKSMIKPASKDGADSAQSADATDKAVKALVENLTVEVERKSQIITVSLDAGEPSFAQSALQELVKAYLELHIEVHAAKADPAFFRDQATATKEELSNAEQKLAEFRKKYAISSIDTETEALLTQIRAANDSIGASRAKVGANQAQLAIIEKAIKTRPERKEISRTVGATNWAADEYKKHIAELTLKESDLSSRYDDSYRPLVELRSQIQQMKDSLAKEGETHTEVVTGIDDNRRQLELELENQRAELDAEEARLKILTESLSAYQERYSTLSSQKVEFDRLVRDVALAEDSYRKSRANLEESETSAALDKREVSNVSVVQPAMKPFETVKPKRVRNIAMGVMLGILMGIALAFVSDYFDDSIKTDADVSKRLGLAVLASIPEDELIACT